MWNVLVVDDEPINCQLLEGILEGKATCNSVGSGEDAVEAFQKAFTAGKPFDMVLLDVAMPGMDGIGVLKRIRQFEELNNIRLGKGTPVIMVTAHTTSFMKAFDGGCDDFILKPVDGDKLIQKMESKIPANRK